MPYVALPASDGPTRRALAETRWAAMLARRPELGNAIALQRKLIGIVIDLAETIESGRLPRLSLPARYVTTKLASGIPALSNEPIQLPLPLLEPRLLELARALADTGGDASVQVMAALQQRRVDVPLLLVLTLRREQAAIRALATRSGVGHDLLWLVADLAVSPFAHALLRSVFTGGTTIDATLATWTRGYCPLCGSWPGYVECAGERRLLRCAFCAAAWDGADRACVYCGEAGERLTTLTPDGNHPRRGVHTCAACRGYLKQIESDVPLPFPLMALADLDSMDLDLAAMQKGCARPAAKQFGRRS